MARKDGRNQALECNNTFLLLNNTFDCRSRSMRCQSLANKHASRALVNLLLPDLEICVGDKEYTGRLLLEEHNEEKEDEEEKGAREQNLVQVIRRNGVEYIPANNGEIKKRKNLMGFLGAIYADHCREMSWTVFYFYSSGTLKDTYRMQLKLCMDGTMAGRGEDNLGDFHMEGQGDRVFGDCSFAFSKTYTNRGVTSRGGHVCHIGFWNSGKILGSLSMGMWGVWETVSGQHHFELKKGGVFRMVPSYVLDEFSGEIEPWDYRVS